MNIIPNMPSTKLTEKQQLRKRELLNKPILQIPLKSNTDLRNLVENYSNTSFQARKLGEAAKLYSERLNKENTIIWSLSGSIFSAGLRQLTIDAIDANMVDVLVCTGALFEQDMLEALGHKHYICDTEQNDAELQDLYIDRVYDHLLDEMALRQVDLTFKKISSEMKSGNYSSRQFIEYCGEWLTRANSSCGSVMQTAYESDVPIFIPALNDSSIGIGIAMSQNENKDSMTIDSIKDLREIAFMKEKAGDTGIIIVGGGVPKNYSQDAVVMAEMLGYDVDKHKFGIQISTADIRDGGLSGSSLKEAISWGKNDKEMEEVMVWGEASVYFPIMINYVYHNKKKERKAKRLAKYFKSK